MTSYEELKQGITACENPDPVEVALEQELPSAAAVARRSRPKTGMMINLIVGGFLAVAVCVGTLQITNKLNSEPSESAKGKQKTTSLWQLFDFNKASAAKKKGIMFGLGADFGGSFDLKPQ
jgi:hypothetical protein